MGKALLYIKRQAEKRQAFEHCKIIEGETVYSEGSYKGTFNSEEEPDGHGTWTCPQYTYAEA